MAGRIDDLEHNINDLMVQAGQAENPTIPPDQKWSIFQHFDFVISCLFSVFVCSKWNGILINLFLRRNDEGLCGRLTVNSNQFHLEV